MRKLLIVFAVLATGVALYALAGYLLVPIAIERFVPDLVARRMHATLALHDVRSDPFRFRVSARDVTLVRDDGALLARADRIAFGVDPARLWSGPWQARDLVLEGIRVGGRVPAHPPLAEVKSARSALAVVDQDARVVRFTAARFDDAVVRVPPLREGVPNAFGSLLRTTPTSPPADRPQWSVELPGARAATTLVAVTLDGPVGRVDLDIPDAAADLAWRDGRVRVPAGGIASGLVHLTEARGAREVTHEVAVTDLRLRDWNVPDTGGTTIGATLALDGARATIDVTVAADADSARGTLRTDGVPLATLLASFAEQWPVQIRGGLLAADGEFGYRRDAPSPVTFRGAVSIEDGALAARGAPSPFATWRRLEAGDVRLDEAMQLTIASVVLDAPFAEVVVSEDRRILLPGLGEQAKPTADASVARASEGGDQAPAVASPLLWRVDRVNVRDGRMHFSDQSLVLPFDTRIEALAGGFTTLSNLRGVRTEVELAGRVAPHGEARVRGSFVPGGLQTEFDVRAEFENVAMPQLTPYSATFAGRRIESGRLGLDLHYRVAGRRFTGDHDVRLVDFRLGERVAAPGAFDLPVDLAISLLRDETGRIDVAVPIGGTLDDPQFGYASLIREALANLVRRVVSAPFRFLGRLAGNAGDQALEEIAFEAGGAQLGPPETERLGLAAAALRRHPGLRVIVPAPFDPMRDAAAIARATVRQALARRLGNDTTAAPVAFAGLATQRALEAMLVERSGRDAVARFADAFAATRGRAPQRLGRLDAILERASPDIAFYEALFDRLAELAWPPEGAVVELAQARGASVADLLAQRGVARSRIMVAGPEAVGAPVDAKDVAEVRATLAVEPVAAKRQAAG